MPESYTPITDCKPTHTQTVLVIYRGIGQIRWTGMPKIMTYYNLPESGWQLSGDGWTIESSRPKDTALDVRWAALPLAPVCTEAHQLREAVAL